MSRQPVILITGAGGEVGHGLIERLAEKNEGYEILAVDLRELSPELKRLCGKSIAGDITDRRLLDRLVTEFEIHRIFHLAAVLSTRAEFAPETAHQINVEGTLGLLKLAVEQARWHGETVKFIFPSSIAVYGLPDLETKKRLGRIGESEHTNPITMYGCNKLYCEHLGRYYCRHYRQLAADDAPSGVDFRAVRYPGLISAFTVPSGGTSDYGPEMIHAAARGEPYACFVREKTRIPFMAMPDAIDAILALMEAPAEKLTQTVYNVAAYNPSAGEFAERTLEAFPGARISFEPDFKRQRIVDTWPARIDDDAARRDWGFSPKYDFATTFDEYLVPNIRKLYSR